MGVTVKAALLALAGAGLILLSGLFGSYIPLAVFAAVNAALLALYAIDCIVTPSADVCTAERGLEVKLTLHSPTTVQITVVNHGRKTVLAEVHDDVPEFFECTPVTAEGGKIPAKILPGGETVFYYGITPQKRGNFEFPAIHVKIYGLLGLCTKQAKIKTDSHYRVYPDMRDISKYSMSSLNRNMLVSGVKRLRLVSNGGEFSSLREYTTDDPYGMINWKATGRKNSLVVNTYMPERNQYIHVMIDSSRVMNSEVNGIKKLDYAINACFLLADYCIRGGDNIGMTAFDSSVQRFVPGGRSPLQVSTLADSLCDLDISETSADYDAAFIHFNEHVHRRSLVFVFTELFNPDEAARFAESVRKYMGKHLVYTITIRNPGAAKIAAITGSDDDSIYKKAAAVKTIQDRTGIKKALETAGIMNSDTDPDRLSLTAVAGYLDIKNSGML